MSELRSAAVVDDGPGVRTLLCWSDASLAKAAAALAGVWRAWCGRWGFDAGAVHAANASDCERPDRQWVAANPGTAWLGAAGQPVRAMGLALFQDADAPIAADVAGRACSDLLQAIQAQASSLGVRADASQLREAPADADSRRWSGAVHFEASACGSFGDLQLAVHWPPALARKVCSEPASLPIGSAAGQVLAPIESAVSDRRVRLRVELDPIMLTLGALQSLHVGDVVKLTHRLDQPLHVFDAGAREGAAPFCAAYLGARSRQRAVELVAVGHDPI